MASRIALVTGANGFVGCYVVRALLARGTAVRALVRKGADLRALEGLPCEFAWGDLRDADGGGAGNARMRRSLPRRRGLSALGARSRADVRRQRRGHAQRPGRGASRQGPPRGPYQHRRRNRHPARRIRARGLAGFARRHGGTLQAIEVPGRAGGAQGRARGRAGRDRQSVHARRPATITSRRRPDA